MSSLWYQRKRVLVKARSEVERSRVSTMLHDEKESKIRKWLRIQNTSSIRISCVWWAHIHTGVPEVHYGYLQVPYCSRTRTANCVWLYPKSLKSWETYVRRLSFIQYVKRHQYTHTTHNLTAENDLGLLATVPFVS